MGLIKEAITKVTGDAKIETEGAAEKDAGKAQNTPDNAKGGVRQATGIAAARRLLAGSRSYAAQGEHVNYGRVHHHLTYAGDCVPTMKDPTMQARPPIDPFVAGGATIPGAAAVVAPEGAPALPTRVSWGAIIAGALVAVAVGTMLNTLGVAIGATVVDATARNTPSATSFGIGAGIWLLVANLIGLAAGGYTAARLSGASDNTDATLHGLGVWATAFLLSAVLLGNVVAGTASTASSAVSSVVGGVARGAGSAVSAATEQVNPQTLIDRARSSLSGPSEPARMTTEQRGAEISSLLGQRIANGSLTDAQRQRLNTLVAAEAGIPPQEAAQRVQAYEAEAQRLARETEERARRTADAAASGTAKAAFWVFAALLLGAIAAVFGARSGARNLLLVSTIRRNVT